MRLVGERVRQARARRGMSRKVLSQASGVSERYLAELERGTGNASLLLLRRIASAMNLAVANLVSESEPDPQVTRAVALLERLSTDELVEALQWLSEHFPRPLGNNLAGDRIALVGLRGAGKTTLGSKAAAALSRPFVELDREIERASGMDLAEIFAVHGQKAFRRLEYDTLTSVLFNYPRGVIATGGSIVTEPATYELLLASCRVIWLRASPTEHMERVAAQGDMRPMAASRQAMEDLEAILASREKLYSQAAAQVDTSGISEAEALVRLLTHIKS